MKSYVWCRHRYAHAYTYRLEARTRATGRLIGERAGKSLARPIETSSSHLFPISGLLVIGYRLPTNKRTRQTRCAVFADCLILFRVYEWEVCVADVFVAFLLPVHFLFRVKFSFPPSRSIYTYIFDGTFFFTPDNNSYDLRIIFFFFFFSTRFSSLISPSRERERIAQRRPWRTIIPAKKEIFLKAGAMRKVRRLLLCEIYDITPSDSLLQLTVCL